MNAEELLTHAGFVRTLARSLVLDDQRAADVEQQTWLAALEHHPETDKAVRSWLFRVVHNFAYRLYRSEKRRARHEREAPHKREHPSSEEVVIRGETGRRLIEAVLRLEEPCRSAILFRYYEDMPPRKIARHLSVPVATVYTRLKRGLAQLRDRLDAEHEGSRKKWMTALAPLAGLKLKSASAAAAAAAPLALGVKVKVGFTALLFLAACFTLVQFYPEQPSSPAQEAGTSVSGVAESGQTISIPVKGDAPIHEGKDRESLVASASQGKLILSGRVVNLPDAGVQQEAMPVLSKEVHLSLPGKPPIPDATTALQVKALGYGGPTFTLEATVVTDAHGKFTIECEDPGTRPLSLQLAVKDDRSYRTCIQRLKVEKDQWEVENLLLERVPHGTLRGRTAGLQGEALAGVRICFHPESGGSPDDPKMKTENTLETATDAEGEFEFTDFRGPTHLDVHARGYRLIESTGLKRIERGGWEPMRITFAPVGILHLRAVDSEGEPVPGVGVRLDVSSAEKEARRNPNYSTNPCREILTGETGADGSLLFPEVWAKKKLVLHLKYEKNFWEAEWIRDGQAAYDSEGRARPIVVAPGGEIALEIPLPPAREVWGRVVYPDGAPAPKAELILDDPDAPMTSAYLHGLRIHADDEGQFRHTIRMPKPPEKLFVTVTDDSRAFHPSGKPSGFDVPYKTSGILFPGKGPVEMVLERTLSIQGRVLNWKDRPLSGYISALSQKNENPFKGLFHGATCRLGKNGEFHFTSLMPGEYCLTVRADLGRRNEYFGIGEVRQEYHHIPAGQTGLELVFQEPALARISVEVHAGEEEEISTVKPMVLVYRFYPRHPMSPDSAVPREFTEVHRYDGWPTAALKLPGIGGAKSKTGFLFGHYGKERKTKRFDLDPVSEGWYWIAVRVKGENGCRYYPTGTGLVYLKPGAYRFRFQLDRMGDLEGRVHDTVGKGDLCVALADEAGQPVHILWKYEYYASFNRTGADGAFFLQNAPVGRFHLRVGTKQELEAGKYRHTQQVNIEEGTNPFLDVYVP